MNIEARIAIHKYGSSVKRDSAKLTGRIMYIKYASDVEIKCEVSYTELGVFWDTKNITVWVDEKDILFHEIPEIVIVGCNHEN